MTQSVDDPRALYWFSMDHTPAGTTINQHPRRRTRPAISSRAGFARLLHAAGLAGVLASSIVLSACDTAANRRASDSGSIFAMIAPPTPAEAARWAVDPYDANKRMAGLNLLANAPFGGDDVYVKVYRMALGAPPADKPDEDLGVRAVAARALALHGQPSDVPLVLPLMSSTDRRVRAEAARTLQRLHNPVAVPALLDATRLTKEDDVDVRAEACAALGQYAEQRVLQALIGALSDDSLVVNRAASKSLSTLTGQDFGDEPRDWLKWLDTTRTPFAQRREYIYPYFERDKFWYEWIPLIPQPPNEQPGSPVGMSPMNTPSTAAPKP